jgi:hypothetical protein
MNGYRHIVLRVSPPPPWVLRSLSQAPLADRVRGAHPLGMFVVSETEADAIRAAFEQHGELSAAVELRRLFPSVTDNVQALACARTIAGWKPLPTTKRRSVKPPRTG